MTDVDRTLYQFGIPIYTGGDPTADPTGEAGVPLYHPWIRSDIAEPNRLRWYNGSSVMKTTAEGLTTTAVHEADAATKMTHAQVMARGVYGGLF